GFELGPHLLAAESDGQALKNSRLIFQPLRLRFVRNPSAASLKDYANPVVIDPLASISAVHDFLWPRVKRHAREIAAAAAVAAATAAAAG
ncbi:hypothetical protein T484DRAFT_1863932, partial [Baffinella frigidus]